MMFSNIIIIFFLEMNSKDLKWKWIFWKQKIAIRKHLFVWFLSQVRATHLASGFYPIQFIAKLFRMSVRYFLCVCLDSLLKEVKMLVWGENLSVYLSWHCSFYSMGKLNVIIYLFFNDCVKGFTTRNALSPYEDYRNLFSKKGNLNLISAS